MGLDMYLMKVKKNDILSSKTMITLAGDLYRKNDRNAVLFEAFEKLGLTYKYTRWEHVGEEISLNKEVAYWRKANAIHKWIYEHCAEEGQKDYEDIAVEKEHIEKLIQDCKTVLKDLENGYDSEVAKEILPTQSGFFFGSTGYDEWYKEELENTIEQCEQILTETDWDTEKIWYYASY